MSILLSGLPVAQALSQRIEADCQTLKIRGIIPTFGIVRVSNRPDDLAYERGACKRAEKLGVQVRLVSLPEDATREQLGSALRAMDADDTVHGCLLFRPLPPHLDTNQVKNILRSEKDVDAITTSSMGRLLTNTQVGFAPCTATACLELLHHYDIPLKGKKTVVIGKSMTVGLPTALLLMNEDANVSVCHIYTAAEDIHSLCQNADIIISAAGCPGLIGAQHVRPGQIIVDVGINVRPDGTICGDVAFDEVAPIVAAITPVPGGVGAITSTVLVGHAVQAAMLLCAQ